MSGTLGSLAGLFIFWICPFKAQAPLLLIFSGIGFYLCGPAVKAFALKDPKRFVTDEVCGMMAAIFWLPVTFWMYLAAFMLFRFFDVLKPWPISLVQKKESPSCIMWDDLLAGLFANLLLRAALFVFPKFS